MKTPLLNISSRIVCDSVAENGVRLTSMLMTYPRFVHAEHMRHRSFSFCVASSRAIASKKFAKLVKETPSHPVWWGKNQAGMQANEELTGGRLKLAQVTWRLAKANNLMFHWVFRAIGLHKQIANRVLEAWMPVTVLTTGTDWKNFFLLRSHAAAQPEMCAASDTALSAYVASQPTDVPMGSWHLPFMDEFISTDWDWEQLCRLSVARCARTSYLNHEGRMDVEADLKLADRLAASGHWSPFEHVATPFNDKLMRSGNFRGWRQLRKEYLTENPELENIDLGKLLEQRIALGSRFASKPKVCCGQHH